MGPVDRTPAALLLLGWLAAACGTVYRAAEPAPAMDRFDDRDWAAVLERHVDGAGRVDFPALVADRGDLDRFVARLAAVSPASHPDWFPSEGDRLAYWINAYNALSLHLAAGFYPVDSVKDVHAPWAQYVFFLPDLAPFFYWAEVEVGGRVTDLKDLGYEVIQARFPDLRYHFALNCCTRGGPLLARRPFRGANLDQQLTGAARRFFAEERNLSIDHERRVVTLSRILEWYGEDFLALQAEREPELPPDLLRYVAGYAPGPLARVLRGRARDYAVEFRPYDWALIDRRPLPFRE